MFQLLPEVVQERSMYYQSVLEVIFFQEGVLLCLTRALLLYFKGVGGLFVMYVEEGDEAENFQISHHRDSSSLFQVSSQTK